MRFELGIFIRRFTEYITFEIHIIMGVHFVYFIMDLEYCNLYLTTLYNGNMGIVIYI